MSEAISIDPARGFVALPASIFDLEISPGAFRALSVLCNLSDPQGYSWASLEQLAEWVHRAKSSVSSYLVELRAAGLVSTETQTRSNGANYRLKIKVLFWSKWVQARKKCSSPAPQKTERSVQPAERLTKVKHKPIKTHHSRPTASKHVKKIYKAWQTLTAGMPYGKFAGHASPALLRDTAAILNAASVSQALPAAEVSQQLQQLWSGLAIDLPAPDLARMTGKCLDREFTSDQMAGLCNEIQGSWQRHWQRPPTTKQFDAMFDAARSGVTAVTMLRLIRHDFSKYQATHN